MTEAELQAAVIELAHACGWTVAHFRPARTEQGWRTPVAADGAGFPDLVLAHSERGVLFVELKADKGRLSIEQERWRDVLNDAGADWQCWRPSLWDHVVETLTGGRGVAA